MNSHSITSRIKFYEKLLEIRNKLEIKYNKKISVKNFF